jgi:uncharacterized protein YhfF
MIYAKGIAVDRTEIAEFWQNYLATLPADAAPLHYVAEQLGDSADLADELSALIDAGSKSATCSALWEWEADGNPLPLPGLHTIVLDGTDRPVCIVETTEVTIRRFANVDADFAAAEGEDDRSLEAWRAGHWRYFSRVLPRIGRAPSEDMPLVCERFRVVYPRPAAERP